MPDRPLAFGGPGKTGAELAAAIRTGTARFHVESPHELSMLAAAAQAAGRPADILLRVNPPGAQAASKGTSRREPKGRGAAWTEERGTSDQGRGRLKAPRRRAGLAELVMGGQPSPFGMDMSLLARCAESLALMGRGPLRLRGLHAHLASGLGAGELLAEAGRLVEFGRDWCARHGVTDPEFGLGGGMAVDYRRPDAVFDWDRCGRGLAGLARAGETLRIEPGRAVTAYCGWYLTRVLDVKRSHGEAFAVVAGGTHHLRTPAAKGHDQPFTVVPVDDWAPGWPRPGVSDTAVTIAGQLCTPKDVLARRVVVPRLRAGDLVAFGLAGAYAWNISHHSFLMHPPPAFHYL